MVATRSKFRFFHPLRVRWSEVDKQGVVFHGNYLNYFDVAMTEYMRAAKVPYPAGLVDEGSDLFVRKSVLEYLGAVNYDDELEIGAHVSRVGNSSLTFEFSIFRKGEDSPLITGQNIYVNVHLQARQPVLLPEDLTNRVNAMERGD